MCSLMANLLLPANLRPDFSNKERSSSIPSTTRSSKKKKQSMFPVARLFGQAIFKASKLNVMFLGVDEKKHPSNLPRTYTLTHSDITANLTLAISHSINNSQLQGWGNRLYRDEVVAEWRKVLKAFVCGDENMLNNYPELQDAFVWVYFHSNIPEFNKVECWGTLCEATSHDGCKSHPCETLPEPPCLDKCSCCFPTVSTIPWSHSHDSHGEEDDSVAIAGGLVTKYMYNRIKQKL
ncbi:protein STAY-GREEN 1, chloroplastic isoform X2 [Arabidopsis lyrata subsp. lyrata]|uniref:protein STAY-GREEN 1, chloroplastic isoform X2 n=1 Tax=Arabidopsis lyrata subsp. lyrata TaxID=81972 RepID=UPI000A29D0CD|nr:protein STAY-GREEN 1, chloroplastic isoform X2 [Arabidopsis lyrata subsp. lyrata]|eukprot:XP_020877716.1 protein STAY-GREEN 1, chloroplastic isoform X2 [Arabidopsis lyrata subsp. lyrata]